MPDILEINKAAQAEWMGAKVGINVYEWLLPPDRSVQCPQVVIDVPHADGGVYRAWLQIHPDAWPTVTPEYIINWFKEEIAGKHK